MLKRIEIQVIGFSLLLLGFQNCTNVHFSSADLSSATKTAGQPVPPAISTDPTTDNMKTNEDVALSAAVTSFASLSNQPSTFAMLSSPSSGALTSFDTSSGQYTYTPKSHFFGRDQFQITETNPQLKEPITRTVVIDVQRTGEPFVISDLFNFYLNATDAPFTVQVGDVEESDPVADLSPDGSVITVQTPNGVVKRNGVGFTYTPKADFRGTDHVQIFVHDGAGGIGSRDVKLVVGNPLQSIQPGMAVRAANCIQCHAKISSNFVTDFGYGSSYFFALDHGNPTSGDWIYSMRMAGDSGAKTWYPDWITSAAFANSASLVVPAANLGFKYADYAPTYITDKTPAWMQATTIKDLMVGIQSISGATFSAPVVEKQTVYIGAPSVAQIKTAGQLDANHPVRYWKDSDISPDLAGLNLVGGVYTNTDTLACDGDLFVDGTVFLNNVSIQTISGCRLYVTGVVFVQKAITYVPNPNIQTNPNLQIVSPHAISMGVGVTQCEATTDPGGWYNQNHVANPLQERFVTLVSQKGIKTRNTDPSSGFPLTANSETDEGNYVLAEAAKIPALDDASCHGRGVGFERLMLVAPLIHSRYKGNFSGVIIGEYPMFSLQNFVYQFDPVFLKIPVLPLISSDSYLKIQ